MLKNIILIVALIPMLSSISNATCPDATWVPQPTLEYPLSPTCTLYVDYCSRGEPFYDNEIYIGDFWTDGEGCSNLPFNADGYPAIDWADVWLQAMIAAFGSEPVFDEIEPCDFGTSESQIWKYIVKTGGCYERGYQLVGEPPMEYFQYTWTACPQNPPTSPAQCWEFYKVCWKWVNNDWFLHTEPGPTMPWNFNCTLPCKPFCE